VPAVQDAELHRVADFLLRLGDLLVASGAATSDVEAAVMASANALGVSRAEVDVTFNAVTVTLVHPDGPPITQVRVVRQRAANYARLSAVHNLVIDLVAPDGSTYRLKNSNYWDSADNVITTYTVNLSSEAAGRGPHREPR
jgi:uncharacterized membrane protein YjjP (DUF1212 family)